MAIQPPVNMYSITVHIQELHVKEEARYARDARMRHQVVSANLRQHHRRPLLGTR
jgi:hypothetical protein